MQRGFRTNADGSDGRLGELNDSLLPQANHDAANKTADHRVLAEIRLEISALKDYFRAKLRGLRDHLCAEPCGMDDLRQEIRAVHSKHQVELESVAQLFRTLASSNATQF